MAVFVFFVSYALRWFSCLLLKREMEEIDQVVVAVDV